MRISKRLRRAREQLELSASDLSGLANLHPTFVGMIERGIRPNPSVSTLVTLARALGVTCDWLAKGEGPEPSLDEMRTAVNRARAEREERQSRKAAQGAT